MTDDDAVIELILSRHGLLCLLDDGLSSLLINPHLAARLLFTSEGQQGMSPYEVMVLSSFRDSLPHYMSVSTISTDADFRNELEYLIPSEQIICLYLRSAFICSISPLPVCLRERTVPDAAVAAFMTPLLVKARASQSGHCSSKTLVSTLLEDESLPGQLAAVAEAAAPAVIRALSARRGDLRDLQLKKLSDDGTALYCAVLKAQAAALSQRGPDTVCKELNQRRLQLAKAGAESVSRAGRSAEKFMQTLRIRAELADDATPAEILKSAQQLKLTSLQQGRVSQFMHIRNELDRLSGAGLRELDRQIALLSPADHGIAEYLRKQESSDPEAKFKTGGSLSGHGYDPRENKPASFTERFIP